MPVTTLSSREFNQDRARANKAAEKGPVFITRRGRPALVLLTFDDYRKMAGMGQSIADLLAMPPGTPEFDFDFDPPRLLLDTREIDLT